MRLRLPSWPEVLLTAWSPNWAYQVFAYDLNRRQLLTITNPLFNFKFACSVQVGSDLFSLSYNSEKYSNKWTKFTCIFSFQPQRTILKSPIKARFSAALTASCEDHRGSGIWIYLTGGLFYAQPIAQCESYDPLSDEWNNLPNLNIARSGHSCTQMGNLKLFVFCGRDGSWKNLNSIELLNFNDDTNGKWNLIKVSDKKLPTRYNPLVVPMSKSEILVMGGGSSNIASDSDLHIYNSDTNKVKRLARSKLTSSKLSGVQFVCQGN